jgi:hypothetical protein
MVILPSCFAADKADGGSAVSAGLFSVSGRFIAPCFSPGIGYKVILFKALCIMLLAIEKKQ